MIRRQTPRMSVEVLEARETPAVLYVDPTGADVNLGTSAAPLQTIQAAANRATAGDTVLVRAGTYRGFNSYTSGTAAARITFQADPNAAPGAVVINLPNERTNLDGINLEGASYVTIQGFTVTGQPRAGIRAVINEFTIVRNNVTDSNGRWGIFTGFSSDLTIENNQASRSKIEHGIYVSNSADRPVIRGNSVFENNGSGIQLNADVTMGGDGIISNAVIENNVIRANGAGGGASINLDGVQNSDIRNNKIESARATGIALFRQNGATGSENNRIVNNTIIVDNSLNQSKGRWGIALAGGSTGNVLSNNVVFSTQSFAGAISASADSLAGLVSDYNAAENQFSADGGNTAVSLAGWSSATGQDQHSVALATTSALDGLFVNRTAGNYRLVLGSAAIDRGTATGAPLTDLEGRARPSGAGVDIGAYEYASIATPPAPKPPAPTPPTPPAPTPPAPPAPTPPAPTPPAPTPPAPTPPPPAPTPPAPTPPAPPAPTNTPPTISAVRNITIAYRSTNSAIAFTIGDLETAAGSLVVGVTSSNPSLIPPTGLSLGGSGSRRTLMMIPVQNKAGTSVITLSVTDAAGLTTTTSFVVTVVVPSRRK